MPLAPSPPSSGRSAPGLRRAVLWGLVLVLLIGATVLGAHNYRRIKDARRTLAGDGALLRDLGTQLTALQRENAALQQRLTTAEAAQTELRRTVGDMAARQQVQAQSLAAVDATLLGARTRFQLAAVEELLQLAADRVVLARDRASAATALELADARLAALADARLLPVRQALARERLALLAVPVADVAGAALSLSRLIAQAEAGALPLAVRPPAAFQPTPDAAAGDATLPPDAGWPRRLAAGLRRAFDGVVRVRREPQPVSALLPPGQEALIAGLLASRLEAARLAVLREDFAAAREALAAARDALARYYRSGDAAVTAAAAELERLAAVPPAVPLPVPTAALQALRQVLAAEPAANVGELRAAPAPAATPAKGPAAAPAP